MLVTLGLAAVLVVVAIGFVALAYARRWTWTGIPSDPGDGSAARPARPGKTVWDWLQLVIVPLVVAVAAFALNAAEISRQRAQDRDRERSQLARADSAAREQTLRDYLQQMAQLMRDTDLANR